MTLLNQVTGRFVDTVLLPFRNLDPIAGLIVLSVLVAVCMLLVMRRLSNQPELARIKRLIQACIFEVRLFNDDLRAMVRAVGELARHNLTYLRLSMVPMLWMLPVLLLLFAQLQFHYGYSAFKPGDLAIVKVRLSADRAPAANESDRLPRLEAPEGIRVETPAVSIPSLREVAWRIAVDRPGSYELRVALGDQIVTKTLSASAAIVRLSPRRTTAGFLDQFLYPAEPPLDPRTGIESIAITYPERSVAFMGIALHWLFWFFLLTTVFAFVLRRPLKVVL